VAKTILCVFSLIQTTSVKWRQLLESTVVNELKLLLQLAHMSLSAVATIRAEACARVATGSAELLARIIIIIIYTFV